MIMEDICRLCYSTKFVNNNIFEEKNALYLKMSLCLPIKVMKNDRLPQKICDTCFYKVNDFDQFCKEIIDVQERLHKLLEPTAADINGSTKKVDLTCIKHSASPLPPAPPTVSDTTQPEAPPARAEDEPNDKLPSLQPPPIIIKQENYDSDLSCHIDNYSSDEDILSINLKDRKTKKTVDKRRVPPKHGKKKKNHNIKLEEINVNNNSIKARSRVNPHQQGTQPVAADTSPADEPLIEVAVELIPTLCLQAQEDNFSYQFITEDYSSDENISLLELKKRKDKNNVEKQQEHTRQTPNATFKERNQPQRNSEHKVLKEQHQENLRKKQGSNISGKVYNCCMCFAEVGNWAKMLQHYREHVGEAAADAELPAPPPPPAQGPLQCTRCLKRLSRAEWSRHWRRHYERDRRPYRCALCGRAYTRPIDLLQHGQDHHSPQQFAAAEPVGPADELKIFLCDRCPERFASIRSAHAHRTRAHPAAAALALALRCARCPGTFATAATLRRHLRAHAGINDFLCNVCGKAMANATRLNTHLRMHSGEKPHVCKTCGKAFVNRPYLILHERVHTGEKPYVCSQCGKGFSQRTPLVVHQRSHSGERPFSCALCGRGFVTKGLLSMHLKNPCTKNRQKK